MVKKSQQQTRKSSPVTQEIRIYIEGGGDYKETKAKFRKGIREFLDQAHDLARSNGITLRLIVCGGRNSAFRDYCNAQYSHPNALNILLVDAEVAVTSRSVLEHLKRRDPSWAQNPEFHQLKEDSIHLMAQVMETWILADLDCLARYYGQHFNDQALPRSQNLELVSKQDITNALNRATEKTQKGKYHKINHGPDLLGQVDPQKVRARCFYCDRFWKYLETYLQPI